MATGYGGTYNNGKWFSSATIEFPYYNTKNVIIQYNNAIIDTGCPIIVVPGRSTSPSPRSDQLPSLVSVEIPAFSPTRLIRVDLSPRDRLLGFGGIGGTKLDRYVFWASLTVEGFQFDDLVGVVFLDPRELDHPIIGISEIVKAGYAVEFSTKGFRVRKLK